MNTTTRIFTGVFLVLGGVVLLTVFVADGIGRPSWPEELRYLFALGRVFIGLFPFVVGIRFILKSSKAASRPREPFSLRSSADHS
jgi:hypothetical protein